MPRITTKINQFSGGQTEEKRSKDLTKFSITKHFDVFTFPHKLVPYLKTEADEQKAYSIVKFLYADRSGVNRLFGFGIDTGTKAAVYMHSTDMDVNDWETPNNNASAVSNRNTEVFFHYKGYIYMFANSAKLIRFDVTSAAVFNDSYQDITYTNLADPVHHPADDCAYFFADNLVYRLDNTTWDGLVLTLPANLKVVSACPYGNYLAIGCVDLNLTYSVVYLWDRDSSLATITDRIDFGSGELKHLANLNNKLIGVMNFYIGGNDFGLRRGKVLIKQANGDFAVTLNEILTDAVIDTPFFKTRQVVDNKLYFPLQVNLNSDARLGIWVVDEFGRATLDTIESEATSYEGIFKLGNQWWIAHSADGSVNRTDNNLAYSSSLASLYESLKFDGSLYGYDASFYKKLVGVTVMTESSLAYGSASLPHLVLKYRKDGASAWKTAFYMTAAQDVSMSHEVLHPESRTITVTIASPGVVTLPAHGLISGDQIKFTTTGALPTGITAGTIYFVISAGLATDSFQFSTTSGGSAVNTTGSQSGTHTLHIVDGFGEYQEIEFRIESYGGVILTGLEFTEEIIKKNLYDRN